MIIPVKTQNGSYNIYLERGALSKAGEYFKLDRKVLIVTDSGVPVEYAKTVAKCCKIPVIVTIEMGERSKNMDTFKELLGYMVENNFTRTDCVVAVGGGVVGDLSGFVASTFMRGVDFYNIPTTMLSQVDSSIGGKTAIDFMGYKNIVGAFYPPMGVLIDPDTLKTLPKRQLSNGLAEALKMSATSDKDLFAIFENDDIEANIDTIIERSLRIKKYVVEEDEKEAGLRKILNFGHTLAHAIESANDLEKYYHGECVGIGMLPMCDYKVRERLLPVLKKLQLPTNTEYTIDDLLEACRHDKKASGDTITIVYVSEIGNAELKNMSFEEYEDLVREGLEFDPNYRETVNLKQNIVLTGMPGSGKTTIGKLIAEETGMKFIDTDEEIVKRENKTIPEIFEESGEKGFRKIETEVIADISVVENAVISTGGGAILNKTNIDMLRKNGRIYFIDRALEDIVATSDRPLSSNRTDLEKRYSERYELYCSRCDKQIKISNEAYSNMKIILEDFYDENTCD